MNNIGSTGAILKHTRTHKKTCLQHAFLDCAGSI